MKQLLYYILAVALLFGLCVLIVRGQRPRTEQPDETGPVTESNAPATKDPDAPASATDLFCPEPYSEAAQAALDDLYTELRSQDCRCAVAYLGTVPENTALAPYLESSGLLSGLAAQAAEYAFLPELTPAQCAEGGFAGLYCLVPLPDSSALCLQAGEQVLYQAQRGEPLLFTAGSAGVQLRFLTPAGEQMELTLQPQADGKMEAQSGLLDFTKQQ